LPGIKDVSLEFLVTLDFENGFIGTILHINKNTSWELNIPIFYEANWQLKPAPNFYVCSDIQGQNSASCLLNKFLTWYTPFQQDQIYSFPIKRDLSSIFTL